MKPDSESKGPYNLSVNIGWDNFLGVVAENLVVVPSCLVVTSFEWHWLKPASGPWLPVQDENGFTSMLKKVKSKSDPYIIVRMQAPTQRKAMESSWDAVDELESDFEDNQVSKKGKLDDALEEIVAKLAEKYHAGLCDKHPDLPCFHHRPSKLHFKLDRPRLLVWAQAIKSGSSNVTYEKAPILSPMFNASLALKRASKVTNTETDTTSAVATSIPPTSQPSTSAQGQMPTMPFANVPQYSQALFPQITPYFGNPFAAGPSVVSMPTKTSPPSLPPNASCTIAEFCEMYDLGNQTVVGLENLGFRFGDELSSVTAEEYTAAGFKPLEWRRVINAYRQLKRDTCY